MSDNKDLGSLPPTRGEGQGQTAAGEFSYSAGNHESYHDDYGRIAFRRGQSLYHRTWYLVVTDLAEDYRSNHDGWESTWPLEFRIYEGGAEIARFDVECEFEPTFCAYHKDSPAPEGVAIKPAADGEARQAKPAGDRTQDLPPGGHSHEG